MQTPYFLDIEDVLLLHQDQISAYGGDAAIRDEALLASAVAAPQATFCGSFLNQTIHEQAAAYLIGLCKNHPFIDGNKRTALATMLAFLALNDISLSLTSSEAVQLVLSVATDVYTKSDVVRILQAHTV